MVRGILETIVRNSVGIADVDSATDPLVPVSLVVMMGFTGTRVRNRVHKTAWYAIRQTASA